MSRFGSPLARGRTAEIFLWNQQQILKLYRAGYPSRLPFRERENARLARTCGIKTPSAYDLVTHEKRFGIVFDRLEGATLFQQLAAGGGDAIALARRLAELHADLHDRSAEGLPAQRPLLAAKIERAPDLSPEIKAIARETLADLPEGGCWCHGDFHPGNVVATTTGDSIIDWLDATQGNAIADVARTILLLACTPLPSPQLNSLRMTFISAYVRAYRQTRSLDREALAIWMLPVAVARCAEPLPDVERATLQRSISALSRGDRAWLDAIYP